MFKKASMLLSLLLVGCSGVKEVLPVCSEDANPACAAIRCTDFQMQGRGYFTSSSGGAYGRQITFYGELPAGLVVEAERCVVRLPESPVAP